MAVDGFENVGPTVMHLRTLKGWTQAALAYHAGLAVSHVCQIETGKRYPGSRTLYKLARALGVEVRDLFGESGSRLSNNRRSADDGWGDTAQEEVRRAIRILSDYGYWVAPPTSKVEER